MKIGYVINSHITFKRALDVVLRGMYMIPREDIYIALGGVGKADLTGLKRYNIMRASYQTYDFYGAIELVKHPKVLFSKDAWFMLSDTCQISEYTPALLQTVDNSYDIVRPIRAKAANIARVKSSYLWEQRDLLLSLDNLTKRGQFETEDILFNSTQNRAYFEPPTFRCLGYAKPYNGAIRSLWVFHSLRMFKWSANTGKGNYIETVYSVLIRYIKKFPCLVKCESVSYALDGSFM